MVFCFCFNVGFFFFFFPGKRKHLPLRIAPRPAPPLPAAPFVSAEQRRAALAGSPRVPAPSAGRGGRGGGAAAPRGYPGPGALSAPRSGAASRGRCHLRPRGGWERGRGGGRNPPARTRPFGAPRVLGGRLRDGGARRGGDLREPLPEGTPSSGLALLPLHLDRGFLFFLTIILSFSR